MTVQKCLYWISCVMDIMVWHFVIKNSNRNEMKSDNSKKCKIWVVIWISYSCLWWQWIVLCWRVLLTNFTLTYKKFWFLWSSMKKHYFYCSYVANFLYFRCIKERQRLKVENVTWVSTHHKRSIALTLRTRPRLHFSILRLHKRPQYIPTPITVIFNHTQLWQHSRGGSYHSHRPH